MPTGGECREEAGYREPTVLVVADDLADAMGDESTDDMVDPWSK